MGKCPRFGYIHHDIRPALITCPHHLPGHSLSVNTQGHCFHPGVCLPTLPRNESSLLVFTNELKVSWKDTTTRLKISYPTYLSHACVYVNMLMCKMNTHPRTATEWRNRNHQDFALPWRQKWAKLLFRELQKQVRRIQHPQKIQMNKRHIEETGKVCDISSQQLFTLWHSMATLWEKSYFSREKPMSDL